MTELQEKAIKKIEDGCRNYKGSKHGSAVVRPVADTLEQFCENNDDFAAAVLGEDKHFADCIAAVTHGVGEAISDIEAYRRAVRYFFPDADVKFDMRIILPSLVDKPVETVENQPAADQGDAGEIISIFDIL